MTQLILNGILLPQTSMDRYAAYEELLTRQVTMMYACLAKAWIKDEDAVPDKAAAYYRYIVQH